MCIDAVRGACSMLVGVFRAKRPSGGDWGGRIFDLDHDSAARPAFGLVWDGGEGGLEQSRRGRMAADDAKGLWLRC